MAPSEYPYSIHAMLAAFERIVTEAHLSMRVLAERFVLMDSHNTLVISDRDQRLAFQRFRSVAIQNGEWGYFLQRYRSMYQSRATYLSGFFLEMCRLLRTFYHQTGSDGKAVRSRRFEALRQAQPSGRWARFFGTSENLTRDEEAAADYIGAMFITLGFLSPSFEIAEFVSNSHRYLRYKFVKHVAHCLAMAYRPWEAGIEGSRSETPSSDSVKRLIGIDDVHYVLAFGHEIAGAYDDDAATKNELRALICQLERDGMHKICVLPRTRSYGHQITMYGHERQFITGDQSN
jgi:hypothetical protein